MQALKVRGLTKRFGKRTAINRLDLTIEPGEIYGFLGPNGAGKTTAMRCILGLSRPDAGEISIFGQTDLTTARRHIGALIETPAFYSWMTGVNNLIANAQYAGLSRKEAHSEALRVLDLVGLAERGTDRASTYSLGMKQRLGIARALLGRPKLLLLDEPTNGLDPRGMKLVRDVLTNLSVSEGVTVFVSSHLLADIEAMCTQVGIVVEGQMRAEGSVLELMGDTEGLTATIITDQGEDAINLIKTLDWVTLLNHQSGALEVSLTTQPLSELNRLLVEAQIPINALIPKQSNLEDVFLKVTD